MALFTESEELLAKLSTLDEETLEAPPERISTPGQARSIYQKLEQEDADSAYNRSLVQGQMDFAPPHSEQELEDKGQSDRFNITTGEGPAIKNEAVSAYLDIYTTPKTLADIPLTEDVDPAFAGTYSQIMAEEFTAMDRSDDASLPAFLQLADTYVTHGVAVGFFEDKQTMQYSVAGLDHFKFARRTGIISSKVEITTAKGEMTVAELYGKIRDGAMEGWNETAVRQAIAQAGDSSSTQAWNNWEDLQREIKSNDAYVSSICPPVEVIFTWVKEFSGKISFYISSKEPLDTKGSDGREEFLFRGRDFYDSCDEAFQLFCFSVGNGARLYTVRGLGYLIYQLCNAMDVMHCKLLDNARIGSSLIIQPVSVEDMQDTQIIDAGPFIAIPPSMRVQERPIAQNLNNSLLPAINESRNILNRATGGLASGNLMLEQQSDRRTSVEVSAQLDYINKLNGFAISLFYGPYDKLMREKVKRAFTVRQKDRQARLRVEEMKRRCIERGVPEEVLAKIDFKRVRAARIIGNGSRASRIMLMDEIGKNYGAWDAVGRNNFDFDRLVELVGVDKAERYAGKPNENRQPYDYKIAQLENFQLKNGEMVEPTDSENHIVHLGVHIEALEAGLKGVDEGQIDLVAWTQQHQALYQHVVAQMEMTTVNEAIRQELNAIHQRVQQIGEIVVNGMRQIHKLEREQAERQAAEAQAAAEQQAAGGQPGMPAPAGGQAADPAQQKLRESDLLHKQKMQQLMELHLQRLQQIKEAGQQKQVMEVQKAMSKIALRSAEDRERMAKTLTR